VGCRIGFFVGLLLALSSGGWGYEFYGRHLVSEYYDCDLQALCDADRLSEEMKGAVAASGAHLLGSEGHSFDGGGFSMVLLLSESHASIHTYPEYGACFIDLFTCGQNCSAEKFDTVLREYLKPQRSSSTIMVRK
jgi:S-adenosylmethionine decarboxylase